MIVWDDILNVAKGSMVGYFVPLTLALSHGGERGLVGGPLCPSRPPLNLPLEGGGEMARGGTPGIPRWMDVPSRKRPAFAGMTNDEKGKVIR